MRGKVSDQRRAAPGGGAGRNGWSGKKKGDGETKQGMLERERERAV
jgi:hypothetical protein